MSSVVTASPTLENKLPLPQVVLVYATLVALCYLPALHAPFIFDDYLNLVNNPQIRSILPTEASWRESRPVGFATFAINYACHGLHPAGFRLVNLLIHLATGCTLFVLIRDTLQHLPNSTWRERAERIAFGTALLWLLHPLQTSAITCIVQRFEALMGLCFLFVLWALQRSHTHRQQRWMWQVGAVVSFWLGMGCKEVMATCLPVALLYDRIFLASSWRVTFRERGMAYAGMVLSFVWLGWVVTQAYGAHANATAGFGMGQISAWEYLRSQPAVILYYLRSTFFPAVLCLDYGWPIETNPWRIYGFGALVVALFCSSAMLLLKRPALGFVAISFFMVLAPTSSFMPIADLAFEHRMYLPAAVVILLAVLAVEWLQAAALAERRQDSNAADYARVVLTLVALALSLRTIVRNVEYRDPARIWQGAIAMNPQHARSYFLLAEHYTRIHRDEAAVEQYQVALRLRPQYIAAYNNLALALARLGRHAEAQDYLTQAIAQAPEDPFLYFNRARLLAQQQDWPAARQAYEKTLQLAPHYTPAQKQLAAVLSQQSAPPPASP